MIDKTLHMSLLFDTYGELLTARQRSIFTLYYEDDLSLGEIAAQHGISRQAVYDMLKRAVHTLAELEDKLSLVSRDAKLRPVLSELHAKTTELTACAGQMPELVRDVLLAYLGDLQAGLSIITETLSEGTSHV